MFFKKKSHQCPIPEDIRIWMENSFIWLINEFGEKIIIEAEQLQPISKKLELNFDGSDIFAYKILEIVAKHMLLSLDQINLYFYKENLIEIQGDMGSTLFSQQYENEIYTSGFYLGTDSNGKHSIAIERKLINEPDRLIATFSHELAHIKLLGEERLKVNDEYLTDLVTVFFGLGIFTANASFKFFSDYSRWGFNKQGYLTQQEWGYALALFSYIREEKDPGWLKFLSINIQSDYKKSQLYIYSNIDKVLV